MPIFKVGSIFIDKKATNIQGEKTKYFIGMNNADELDDIIVSFIFNTEHRMDLYHLNCNKEKQKFIIAPKTFPFINNYTSIMLSIPCFYTLKEIINNENIEILNKADNLLSRMIKNCIDWKFIPIKYHSLIKDSFK